MKIDRKRLLVAALFALALPLVFSGVAGAVTFNPDGAQRDANGVMQIPPFSNIWACYNGSSMVDVSTRFECRNTEIPSLTTASTCGATATIPGWTGAPVAARWSFCSEGGYSTVAGCTGAGGTSAGFTRCNRELNNADCTALGYTAGTSGGNPTCRTTTLTVAACQAVSGTTAGGIDYLGSAGVSGATTTCTIYIGNDAADCSAAGGTITETATDQTRGFCGGNLINRFTATDTAPNPMGGTNADWSATSNTAPYRKNCLKCHQPAYMDGETVSYAGSVAKYIYASHRNSSRKIIDGEEWSQVHGSPETFGVFSDWNGRLINWTDGTIETYPGSGLYTEWYWYWGYYFEDPSAGSDIAENTIGNQGAAQNVITVRGAGGMTACMYCHGTGFSAENTLATTKEPVKTFGASIAWNGTDWPVPDGAVNLKTSFNNRSNVDDSVFVPSTSDCAALGGTRTGTGSSTKCVKPGPVCLQGGTSIPGATDWTGAWVGLYSAKAAPNVPTSGDCALAGGTIVGGKCVRTITPGTFDNAECFQGGSEMGGWVGTLSGTTCTIVYAECRVTTAYLYNSWDEFGVLCSNCHASVDTSHQNSTASGRAIINWNGTLPQLGTSINAVCLQCHGKAGSSNAQNTAMNSENFANSADISGSHPNYHGSQFLNSPHARYNGSYSQINDPTKYSSSFVTDYGGCEGCHDPHGSVREPLLDPALMGAAVAEEGIKKTCADCHTSIADINHNTVPGCVNCHMPGGSHLFRIAADNVTPKADGAYTDASWSTATAVCQQCHSASGGAIPFTAAQASAAAKGMHDGGSSNNADCLACHAAIPGSSYHHGGDPVIDGNCQACHGEDQHSGNALNNTMCLNCHSIFGAPPIQPGVNHHGLHSDCMDCHRHAAVPNAASNAFCVTCHTNNGPYAVHHGTANVSAACNSCHTTPGVTVPPATDANCMACHNTPQTTTTNVPVYAIVQTGDNQNHHVGTCTNCHEEGPSDVAAGKLAINAWETAPNINAKTATKNTRETPNFWYWAINTSLRTACLECHSTTQPKSGGGTTGAIIPSSTGDNHHNGHSSVPGLDYDGVAKIVPGSATNAGSRGDGDPGMNCLGCHGKAKILSGDNTVGYTMAFTASGLSTSTVAAQNGRTDTSGLCLGCHEVIQAGADADHHAGECVSCHYTDGSFSGTYPAGVGSGIPSPELDSSCLMCHSKAQGSVGAINPTVMNHLPGTGTPAGFAPESCAKCHDGENTATAAKSYAGVAPNISASCGQCHDSANYVAAGAPLRSDEALAEVADGMHEAAPVSYPVTFSASSSGLTVNVSASVNCGGTCPTFTYDWNWGDGSQDLGGTASMSHLYATAGSKSIKLTVRLDGKTVGTSTRSVTLTVADGTPVASGTADWNPDTWTLSITDTSTDTGPAPLQIVVNWGDGTTKSIGVAGQTFTHVYGRTGSFPVTLRANDPALHSNTATVFTATPAYFKISGVVQDASRVGLTGATVKIMRGTTVVKTMVLPSYTFDSGAILKPGTYTLTATKAGYTFPKPAATVNVGPSNTTVELTAAAPSALAPARLSPARTQSGVAKSKSTSRR